MEFRRVLFRSHAGCADSCRPEKARHRKNRPARERRAQSPGLSLWSHFPLQRRWRRHSHGTSSVECRSLRRSRRRIAAGTDAKLERSEKLVYRLVLEIGRATCRERGSQYGFISVRAVSLTTKHNHNKQKTDNKI